jgi:prepilin-type N-terminal cleavage/methylation domain-containing protein
MSQDNLKGGFTLIELLVVVAIIGILASVVLASLNSARGKGADAAVKANLASARSQAEIYYEFNNSSYDGVCTTDVGAIKGVNTQVLAAGAQTGVAFSSDIAPNIFPPFSAVCNDSVSAWAAEAPLKTSGRLWCVDSNGLSTQNPNSGTRLLTTSTDWSCS